MATQAITYTDRRLRGGDGTDRHFIGWFLRGDPGPRDKDGGVEQPLGEAHPSPSENSPLVYARSYGSQMSSLT